MTKKANAQPSLEKSLEDITGLIDKMENGELTLEQSLADFERGIHLIKHCQKVLTQAEQKVQVLIQQNQKDALVDYDTDSNEDDADADNN